MEVHDTKTFRVVKGISKHPVGVVRHTDGSATISYVQPPTIALPGGIRHTISGEYVPEGPAAVIPTGKQKIMPLPTAEHPEVKPHHRGSKDMWMSRRMGTRPREIQAGGLHPSDEELADINAAKQYVEKFPRPVEAEKPEPEPEKQPAPPQQV